jgi:hypothetical protein
MISCEKQCVQYTWCDNGDLRYEDQKNYLPTRISQTNWYLDHKSKEKNMKLAVQCDDQTKTDYPIWLGSDLKRCSHHVNCLLFIVRMFQER